MHHCDDVLGHLLHQIYCLSIRYHDIHWRWTGCSNLWSSPLNISYLILHDYRGYATDILATVVKFSDSVPFLEMYGQRLLELSRAEDVPPAINALSSWLTPVDRVEYFGYDEIPSLCEVTKKLLDGTCTSSNGYYVLTNLIILTYWRWHFSFAQYHILAFNLRKFPLIFIGCVLSWSMECPVTPTTRLSCNSIPMSKPLCNRSSEWYGLWTWEESKNFLFS